MTVDRNKQYYCEKCGRTMAADSFYSSNNLEKYPNDGKFPLCKKCLTMHVDNWNPDTYLWILQEADVPYIPDEWNRLLNSYGRNAKKLTGMTILGRYLSKMKLKQYSDYRWADTEHLQEVAKNKIESTMKQQGYSKAEIDDALTKAIQPIQKVLGTLRHQLIHSQRLGTRIILLRVFPILQLKIQDLLMKIVQCCDLNGAKLINQKNGLNQNSCMRK